VVTSYFEVRQNIKGKSLFVGDIRIDNMLDLTNSSVLKQMNIDPAKLTSKVDNHVQQKVVYEYTNQISNQAFEAGYKGIIYSSSRKSGNNKAVVLFGGRYNPDEIKVIINHPID
jgi:filamentous hemagglutinin